MREIADRFIWCFKQFRCMSFVAALRFWYWRIIRWHETELCGKCGRPVHRTITYWKTIDALWVAVEGSTGGVRCPDCFTDDCRAAGIWIHWEPVVERSVR